MKEGERMDVLINRKHFEERVRLAGGMADEELTQDFKDGVLTVLEMLKTETPVQLQTVEQGRNEAWEAARKIMSQNDASWGMKEMKEIFGSSYSTDIMHDLSASEAIEKIRAYEEWKRQGEEIRVGDEVLLNGCAKSVVLMTGKRDLGNYSYIMCSDGSGGKTENWKLKKTGRTFPEIVEVLKKMKEDE